MDNKVSTDNSSIDFNTIIKPYLQKWSWFAVSIIIFIFLGFYYAYKSEPTYKTQASILVKDAKKSMGGGDFGMMQSVMGFSSMGTNSIENEIEVFKSKAIVEEVVKNLNLFVPVVTDSSPYNFELYGDLNPMEIYIVDENLDATAPSEKVKFTINGDQLNFEYGAEKKKISANFNQIVNFPFAKLIFKKNPKFNSSKFKKLKFDNLFFVFTASEKVIDDYQNSIDVELADKEGTVIVLSTQGANKQKTKDFINEIIKQYNWYAINDKNIESKKSKDFIDNRISLIGKELSDVENEKEQFKVRNNIVDIPGEVKLNLGKSAEIDKELLETSSKIELTNMLTHFLSSQNLTQVLPSNLVGSDNPSVATNISSYNKLVIERNRLLESGTPDNPIIKELTSQITNLRGSINESLIRTQRGYEITRSNLASKMNQVEGKINAVPNQEKLFRNIERKQQLKENIYLLLLEKREEAAITLAMTAEKARVIDKAYSSIKKSFPKKSIILPIALALGILFPLTLIFFRELFKTKIVSRDDIQKHTDISIVGEIPQNNDKKMLVELNDKRPFAEAFRILVTNIQFMLPKTDKGNVIFVTSSVKGEGKTLISVNIALALANAQKKVIIVGSDVRNPQLQRYDESKKHSKGLTEFLHKDVENVKDIIFKSDLNPNCDIIYSGGIPPNPTELLQNGRYQELIASLKEDYNYVILDTAPLMLVTDSLLFSEVADATIYVTRSNYSKMKFMDFLNEKQKDSKLKNVGIVINDLKKNHFGYDNSYGYGYDSDKKKKWIFF